jgi:hypothetical protein
MKRKDFNIVVESTLQSIADLLIKKGGEYANDQEVFHNFISASKKLDVSKEKALQGMMIKHVVSIDDLIDNRVAATPAIVNEKINDNIAYLILLKGMLLEKEEQILEVKDKPLKDSL